MTETTETTETTRRITPAEVLDAYAATGLTPARTGGGWFDDEGRGCGAAALIRAKNPAFDNPRWSPGHAAKRLGVDLSYLRGFATGFDGLPMDEKHGPVMVLGYEDGKAAAAAVFGEAAG